MRIYILLVIVFITFSANAQKVHGTVYSENGDLLPFSSISVKGTTIGASANNAAKFSLNLLPGKHTIVCQHVGYITVEKVIDIEGDVETSFVLKELNLSLPDVVVKTGGEDPAYAIIREAIKKRSFYNKEANSFIVDRYGKDIIKLRSIPKKFLKERNRSEDADEDGLDSMGRGMIYLSESISKISLSPPDKIKNEILKSRVSGSNSFGFALPVFINFYTNNVKVFGSSFGPRGFISPISDGAISYYKFKFLGTFYEDGVAINSIRVTPRRTYEPLFTGIINITDGDWRIHSCDLMLTGKSQLQLLDTIRINQINGPVDNSTWKIKTQYVYFTLKVMSFDIVGNFLSVYSNYNIDPKFPKKYFDNVIIKYDTGVIAKEKSYWDSIRPVPLEPEEIKDYKFKDSILEKYSSPEYQRRMRDSTKKYENEKLLLKFLVTGYKRTHYDSTKRYEYGLDGILPKMSYNTVEGVSLILSPYYKKKYLEGQELLIKPDFRYGFSNQHFNPLLSIKYSKLQSKPNQKFQSTIFDISGGKRIKQFNPENAINPLVNTVSTLGYGQNYMKIYENIFVEASIQKKFDKGFGFKFNTQFEDRFPLENTTFFTFHKNENFTPNYPYTKIFKQFEKHQAFIINMDLSFQGGQKYIEFPKSKISLGSSKAVYTLHFSKGINNVFGSDVNFDKWNADITHFKNLKLLGTANYKLGLGGFLNSKKVFIQDYKHFNGNETGTLENYVNGFQLANYYSNSTTAKFYLFGHLEHHFNGLITNKIPLFKRLKWNLVGGGNAFYVNNSNNYSELFVGLENIANFFRIDFIAGYNNGKEVRSAFKFGLNNNVLSMLMPRK